jgi:hypothetical protein
MNFNSIFAQFDITDCNQIPENIKDKVIERSKVNPCNHTWYVYPDKYLYQFIIASDIFGGMGTDSKRELHTAFCQSDISFSKNGEFLFEFVTIRFDQIYMRMIDFDNRDLRDYLEYRDKLFERFKISGILKGKLLIAMKELSNEKPLPLIIGYEAGKNDVYSLWKGDSFYNYDKNGIFISVKSAD